MGDSFILPRACRGGLGPQGARYREEEEDVTSRGSDCVTTLIKMGRAIGGKRKKRKWEAGKRDRTVWRKCQYRGQTLWDHSGGTISTSKQSKSCRVS